MSVLLQCLLSCNSLLLRLLQLFIIIKLTKCYEANKARASQQDLSWNFDFMSTHIFLMKLVYDCDSRSITAVSLLSTICLSVKRNPIAKAWSMNLESKESRSGFDFLIIIAYLKWCFYVNIFTNEEPKSFLKNKLVRKGQKVSQICVRNEPSEHELLYRHLFINKYPVGFRSQILCGFVGRRAKSTTHQKRNAPKISEIKRIVVNQE